MSYHIAFKGNILTGNKTLASADVQNGDSIHLIPNVPPEVIETFTAEEAEDRKLPDGGREKGGAPGRIQVFLCYSWSDKPAVRDLYYRLKACGVRPWFDEEDLLPGQDWKREISKAVRASDVVVVCLSREANTREGFMQTEIRMVLDVAEEKPEDIIFVIPSKLEDCAVPERLRRW